MKSQLRYFSIGILAFTFSYMKFYSDIVPVMRLARVKERVPGQISTTKEDTKHRQTKYILLYTPFVKNKDWWLDLGDAIFRDCPATDCYVTNNRSVLGSLTDFHALLFHDRNMCVSKMPDERTPDQVYIFAFNEAPFNYRVNLSQDKYKSYFNWTMTYRRDSDIDFPYGYTREKAKDKSKVDRGQSEEAWTHVVNMTEKRKTVLWIASHCKKDSKFRTKFGKNLGTYLNVTKYGECFGRRVSNEVFQQALKEHKFYFAQENSMCHGYITEKYWNTLEKKLVPIIMAESGHAEVGPPNSFISAEDFPSIKKLAEYITWLDQNDDEYLKYFEWRKDYEISQDYFKKAFCQICEKLHSGDYKAQAYPDLSKWLNQTKCKKKQHRRWRPCPSNSNSLTEDLNERLFV